jgi:hypothetical protein
MCRGTYQHSTQDLCRRNAAGRSRQPNELCQGTECLAGGIFFDAHRFFIAFISALGLIVRDVVWFPGSNCQPRMAGMRFPTGGTAHA